METRPTRPTTRPDCRLLMGSVPSQSISFCNPSISFCIFFEVSFPHHLFSLPFVSLQFVRKKALKWELILFVLMFEDHLKSMPVSCWCIDTTCDSSNPCFSSSNLPLLLMQLLCSLFWLMSLTLNVCCISILVLPAADSIEPAPLYILAPLASAWMSLILLILLYSHEPGEYEGWRRCLLSRPVWLMEKKPGRKRNQE